MWLRDGPQHSLEQPGHQPGKPPGLKRIGGKDRDRDGPQKLGEITNRKTTQMTRPQTPTQRFHLYLQRVVDGSNPTGQAVKASVERTIALLDDPDVYLDTKALDAFGAFSEAFIIADGHDTQGQNVRLMPWQVWVLGSIIALKWKADDAPVLKESYCEVARGAGKSCMAAVLALWWAVEEPGITVNVLAGKLDQAAIIVGSVKDLLGSTDAHGIEWESTKYTVKIGNSSIEALAAKVHSLDGLRGKFLTDEAHEWRDDVFSKVLSALPKGSKYQMLSVSTPGGTDLGLESIYYATRVVAIEALKDFKKLRHVGSFLYGIDDTDDVSDPKCWIKGQPSLCKGGIITMLNYERAWEAAVASGKEGSFERYQACRYSLRNVGWIEGNVIEAASKKFNIEDFFGKTAYIGLDLSKSFDLSSMCIQIWESQKCTSFLIHWVPAVGAREGYRAHESLIPMWGMRPFINIVETPTIDYDKIRDVLLWAVENFNIPQDGIGVDTLGGLKPTLQEWEQTHKLPLVGIPQTAMVLAPATFATESLIREGSMKIRKDPCFEHCMNNVQMVVGPNGDRRPTKQKSTGCIDPAVAMIMATAVAIEAGALDPPAYRTEADIII